MILFYEIYLTKNFLSIRYNNNLRIVFILVLQLLFVLLGYKLLIVKRHFLLIETLLFFLLLFVFLYYILIINEYVFVFDKKILIRKKGTYIFFKKQIFNKENIKAIVFEKKTMVIVFVNYKKLKIRLGKYFENIKEIIEKKFIL